MLGTFSGSEAHSNRSSHHTGHFTLPCPPVSPSARHSPHLGEEGQPRSGPRLHCSHSWSHPSSSQRLVPGVHSGFASVSALPCSRPALQLPPHWRALHHQLQPAVRCGQGEAVQGRRGWECVPSCCPEHPMDPHGGDAVPPWDSIICCAIRGALGWWGAHRFAFCGR